MPLIIAATDFSEIAENALHYACNLALAKNAKLLIVHSFVFPVMYSDMPYPASLMEDTQADAESKMSEIVDSQRIKYPALDITSKVSYGYITDIIEEYSEKNTVPWLVIIGNSNSKEGNAWFESTLKDASKHFEYPLLAVPPGYAYKPILKICYAFDNVMKGQGKTLMQVREIARDFNAELNIFYAREDGMNRDNLVDVDASVKEILSPANPHFHFEYGVKIDDAILDFNKKNNIDWLAMMPRKHSFFEGLFHNSHTKAIAQHAQIPILLLHENDVK